MKNKRNCFYTLVRVLCKEKASAHLVFAYAQIKRYEKSKELNLANARE